MKKQETQIIILGGGYAGIMAAVRLAGRTNRMKDVQITLLNGLSHFVERPLLHQDAVGITRNQQPITHMLRGTKVQFRQGWITGIDTTAKKVHLTRNEVTEEVGYDYLIYALGSSVNRHTAPGVEEHAYTLDPFGQQSTQALHERLEQQSLNGGQVVVIGGGPTGIEAATEINGRYPSLEVMLVSDSQAGAFKGEQVRAHIAQALQDQGIEVRQGKRVFAVSPQSIQLSDEKIAADIVVWAGGFIAPGLAADAGIRVNERRQILVDPTLRSLSHPNIFAVGDSAMAVEEPGAPMRMSLFVAIVSGAQAADNLAAILKSKTPKPLSYAWYGQGIALGQDDAVGFLTYPADKPSGPILRGKLAVKGTKFFRLALRRIS